MREINRYIMTKRRRQTELFSLSFLDCICCGFGAVILLFVIVNTRTDQPQSVSQGHLQPTMDTREVEQLNRDRLQLRISHAQREIQQLQSEISVLEAQLNLVHKRREKITRQIDDMQKNLDSRISNVRDSKNKSETLKEELKILESELNNLQAAIKEAKEKYQGDDVRAHVGDGYRHYLTGLSLSGKRTLILLDCSASMLSDRIVDVIRRRNLDISSKRRAPKWRQTVAAIDWLLTQLPVDGQFQLYGFNEKAFPVLAGNAGLWLDASDSASVNAIRAAVHNLVPEGGTSLYRALKLISQLSPPPDNVVLMTDGLPTIGARSAILGTVSARRRLHLFNDAIRIVPKNLPINVILYQMEGDPQAASSFWTLATYTRGSFFCPSRDWP